MNSSKIPSTQQVSLFKCNYIHNKRNICDENIYDYNRSLHYCINCILKYGLRKYSNIFIKCDKCDVFFLKHYSYTLCANCTYYKNIDNVYESEYKYIKNGIKENEVKMNTSNTSFKELEDKNFLNYLVSPILSYDFYNIKPSFFNPKTIDELNYYSALFRSDIEFEMFKHQMI